MRGEILKEQVDRQSIIDREGDKFPGTIYAETVLIPAYKVAARNFLRPMIEINKAHLIMLNEQGLVDRSSAATLMEALSKLDETRIVDSQYTGEFEDLFFHVEYLLLEAIGEAAGNLHLGRSRNDMGEAIYRMVLRERLLNAIGELLSLGRTLLRVAEEHIDTVMLAHTHTQQAQPTTLAHYIVAVFDLLERDLRRLSSAYQSCNRSPLGAAALTTSGFTIDRERVAELLAFDDVVENSYDAISGADYLGEIAAALQLCFLGLGRFVQDLLLWSTQEFNMIIVADPYVQASSIMPQKRNPVALEHARSLCSSGAGNTATALTMLHNTPFGDIVDTEDDMQPYLWKSIELADQIFRLLAAVVGTMEVNKQMLLDRARASFATVTELTDTLVREHKLPFRTAHTVVGRVVNMALSRDHNADEITAELVNEAAEMLLGRPLETSKAEVSRALDPVHFVETRARLGGPASKEVRRMITDRHNACEQSKSWHQQQVRKLNSARERLNSVANEWSSLEFPR